MHSCNVKMQICVTHPQCVNTMKATNLASKRTSLALRPNHHSTCPPLPDQVTGESNLFTLHTSISGKLGTTCHNTCTKLERIIKKLGDKHFDTKYIQLTLVYTWHTVADDTHQTST